MRWLAATLTLLAATFAVGLGLYLRDRVPSNWLPPQRTVAHSDAMSLAAVLGGTCPRECKVRFIDHPRADHWTEWIETPSTTICVDINVRTFETAEVNGISGVTTVACEARPSADRR
ncbi:MAG: hypothetical protein ACXVE4_08735 [Solirubrobacteraceae bacterium]